MSGLEKADYSKHYFWTLKFTLFHASYVAMGLNIIVLRSLLALILLCVTVIGEKYHIPDRKVDQKDYSRPRRTEDAQLTDGSIDQSNRPKLTRPSRRFSRPHTLLIPTKSPMVKQAHNAGKDVDKDLTQTQLNASEIHSTLNEVDISEPTRVSVEDQLGLAGGSEDSDARKCRNQMYRNCTMTRLNCIVTNLTYKPMQAMILV